MISQITEKVQEILLYEDFDATPCKKATLTLMTFLNFIRHSVSHSQKPKSYASVFEMNESLRSHLRRTESNDSSSSDSYYNRVFVIAQCIAEEKVEHIPFKIFWKTINTTRTTTLIQMIPQVIWTLATGRSALIQNVKYKSFLFIGRTTSHSQQVGPYLILMKLVSIYRNA
jgi:hypothetical protein